MTGITIPSSLPKIPGWIYHLQRGPRPQWDTQLLTYSHISSHLIPSGTRDFRRKFSPPPSPGSPVGSHSQLKLLPRSDPMGKTDVAADAKVIGSFGVGERWAKKSRAGWAKGKQIFFFKFFFWLWGNQEAARQSQCKPGCAGSRPFPWGLFPKQQQQIGCRFQAGWGNKRKSNQNPLTAEIKGDQRPNTQSAPSSYHSHDGGCFAFRL